MLESTRRVDTVVLDKTGTVTTGQMALLEVHAADDVDADEALRLAGAVEDASDHPIAAAVARGAREWGALPAVSDFASSEGLGVRGTVEGHEVTVGRPAMLESALPAELPAAQEAAQAQGRTAIAVAWNGAARAVLVVADAVKPTSAEAVAQLRDLSLTPVLLPGDNSAAAHAVAAQVGIERHPALPPHAAHDPGQPVLGVRLQRRGAASGRGRAAQPDDRGCGDGGQLGVRGGQHPAAARVHLLRALMIGRSGT